MTYFTFPAGEIIEGEDTSTLVNNTEKVTSLTVPTGKRWVLNGFKILNADDVVRDVYIRLKNSSSTRLFRMFEHGALGVGARIYGPNASADTLVLKPIVMESGEIVDIVWAAGGASAGGTARYTFMVLEVQIG